MSDATNWPQARLGNLIVDMQPGFAQRPGQSNANVPQLRTNNVSPQGTIDLSELIYVSVSGSEFQKYCVQKGDVIFNNTNSTEWVGKTAYFDLEGEYVLSNHMTRLRVNRELLDAEFLALYLHYLWRIGQSGQLSKQWVNQAAIDQVTLSSFQVPLVNSGEKLPKSAEIKIPRVRNGMLAQASAGLTFPRSNVLENGVPPFC